MSIRNLLFAWTVLSGFNEDDGVFRGGPHFGVVLFFQSGCQGREEGPVPNLAQLSQGSPSLIG